MERAKTNKNNFGDDLLRDAMALEESSSTDFGDGGILEGSIFIESTRDQDG